MTAEDIEVLREEEDNKKYLKANDTTMSSLSSHIHKVFTAHRDARSESGVEEEMLSSLRAYNGEYSSKDLTRIAQEGGSRIFMNLTATKCRALQSWLKDILLSGEDPFSISPTTVPELPQEVVDSIKKLVEEKFTPKEAPQAPQGPQAPQQAQPVVSLKEMREQEREMLDTIKEEIKKEAEYSFSYIKDLITDNFEEGNFYQALSDFIDDFSIFPTAILKGPIVSKKKKLKWEDGEPVISEDYCFYNKRVNPLDIYPSPSASSHLDGDFIEHIRLSKNEVSNLKGVYGYSDERILKVLEQGAPDYNQYNTSIEEDIADTELRGSSTHANESVYHGLHFFGSVDYEMLKEWGFDCDGDKGDIKEVEAIMVGNEVIKVQINDDPLLRRPYYPASFQSRPGSFWGRSVPQLMSPEQRMCNATARSLANNMGLSSGPQAIINIDRLADDGAISEIYPLKIWQVRNDPTGNSGAALDFFSVPSNATELLEVYDRFEFKADESTGIPRYAYGSNQGQQGAAATSSGLAMLMESTTKSIKDAVRHIDSTVIIPRVQYEFYNIMIKNDDITFTGDIKVVARGSQAIALKSAEFLKRKEFLIATANQSDQQLMGLEGRAVLLRELAKDLGVPASIVPSSGELRKKLEEQKAMAGQAQEAEMQKEQLRGQNSLQATTAQVEGQMKMNELAQQLNAMRLEFEKEKENNKVQLEMAKLQLKEQAEDRKVQKDLAIAKGSETSKDKELAFKIQTGMPGI